MRIECFAALEELASGHPDLAVPGLDGEAFCSVVCWLRDQEGLPAAASESQAGWTGPSAVEVLRSVTSQWLRPGTAVGWACTAGRFPEQQQALARAGWGGRPEAGPEGAAGGLLFGGRLPEPGSEAWDNLWAAPIDFLSTNVLVLSGPAAAVLPAASARPLPRELSTLLPWPWSDGAAGQRTWLEAAQGSLRLLVLGADECGAGIQFVARKPELSLLRERIAAAAGEGAAGRSGGGTPRG